MRREIRERSGFSHSREAIQVLDHVFVTAMQAATFYEELRQKGRVVIYGAPGHFFLRDNEVRYSPITDRNIRGHILTLMRKEQTRAAYQTATKTAEGRSVAAIRTIRCPDPGCKYGVQVKKEEGEDRSRKPQKIRCPGCGGKLILPLGMVVFEEKSDV